MSRQLRVHIAILFLMALTGCATLVKEPHIAVQSTDVVSIDTTGFDIELLVAVENPNPFDVSLLGYTYNLQIMSIPFSSGGLQRGVLFPAGQRVEVRLPLRVRHSDLIGIIKRRPNLDRIPYSVDARLNLDTPLGEIVVPVKKNDTVSIPEAYRPGTYLKRILQPLK